MSGITFAHPWALLLLPLPFLALAAWAFGMARGRRRARRLSRFLPSRPSITAAVLYSLAAALAIVAAAQPRWGTRVSQVPRTGADLVIVMDISRSMDVPDVEPSRLAAAKAAAVQSIDRLAGDRIGLVIFAGSARIRFPLTTDAAAAARVVESLETGVVLVEGGTDVARGLELALDLLADDSSAGRLVLLLTDGDNLGGDVAAVAERFRAAGVELLVAGVGTPEGGIVPAVDPITGRVGPRRDAAGQPIVSRLDEPFLRALAVAAGGRYLGTNLAVVPGVVEGRIRALERTRLDERTTTLPVERFQLFAGAALAVVILGTLVERFRPRRAVLLAPAAAPLLLLLLAGCASPAYEANERGRAALEAGDAEAAIEAFLQAQVERPNDPAIALNLAAAYHAAGRYEDAIRTARRALESNDPEIRRRAFASIGHHQFEAGRLPEALSAFRDALLLDPADDASRHDFEVVLRLLYPPSPAPSPSPPATPSASPSPSPGQSPSPAPDGAPGTPAPSADGTPVPGQGTPGPGQTGQTPQPGATPQPTPGGGGTPVPGSGGTPGPTIAELNRRIEAIDRQVRELLLEAGEQPTPAQALRILELLAERSRLAQQRDALAGRPGTDY
ncbi:VWA domain-containing protein [Tepidiforma bonchosmolovskayae]|uniref:VWA domain-containing protein n=1 Tax=Tepidiforma bonchosmolovskayae TaxID=2601677 RepID=UPI001787B4F9|nr:VWA domain-containing protein [Tepidiforma bonchosmolovskayae]